MSLKLKEVKKPKKRIRTRRVRKEIFANSPTTVRVIQYGLDTFGLVGGYYATMTLADACFIASPTKLVFAKFGESGIGKTLPEKVAIEGLEDKKLNNLLELKGSKGLTPAGLSLVYRKAFGKEPTTADQEEWSQLANSDFLYLEDLAFLASPYIRKTTAIVLHRLPYETDLSDLTASAGKLKISLGEKKRVMFSGTPDVYDEITSMLSYDEFMNRRCLYLMVWLSPREWRQREKKALQEYYFDKRREEKITEEWVKVFKYGLKIGKGKVIVDDDKRIVRERKMIYKELVKFKRIPESALEKIDAIASGHAIINGRNTVLLEDYEFISLLLWRFVVTGVMRRKELAIFNEVCRRNGKGVKLRDLADYLRVRAKGESIPEIQMSIQSINVWSDLSKFLKIVIDKNRERKVMFTDATLGLIKLWNKVIRKVAKIGVEKE